MMSERKQIESIRIMETQKAHENTDGTENSNAGWKLNIFPGPVEFF